MAQAKTEPPTPLDDGIERFGDESAPARGRQSGRILPLASGSARVQPGQSDQTAQRTLEHAIAEEVVQRLVDEGLQSDQRCIEQFNAAPLHAAGAVAVWSRSYALKGSTIQAPDHDL